MNTNSHVLYADNRNQSDGGVWYELRSEREEICEALLRNAKRLPQGTNIESKVVPARLLETGIEAQLQARLSFVDNATDRLMNGSYGECVKCGRWIEDTKLHADPAFPFCHECERVYEATPPTIYD